MSSLCEKGAIRKEKLRMSQDQHSTTHNDEETRSNTIATTPTVITHASTDDTNHHRLNYPSTPFYEDNNQDILPSPSSSQQQLRRRGGGNNLHSSSQRSLIALDEEGGSINYGSEAALNPSTPLPPPSILVEASSNPIDTHKNIGNHLFGFKPWKGMLGERKLEDRSEKVKQLYMWNNKNLSGMTDKSRFLSVGNVLYAILFGWWMFLAYCLVGILSYLPIFTIPYGKKCFKLAFYYLYPFGKYIEVMTKYRTGYSTEQANQLHNYIQTSPVDDNTPPQHNNEIMVTQDVERGEDYYKTENNGEGQHLLSNNKIKKREWTVLGLFSFIIWIIFLAPIV